MAESSFIASAGSKTVDMSSSDALRLVGPLGSLASAVIVGGGAGFFGAGCVSLVVRVGEPHAASSDASASAANASDPSVRLECDAFMILQASSLTGVRPQ